MSLFPTDDSLVRGPVLYGISACHLINRVHDSTIPGISQKPPDDRILLDCGALFEFFHEEYVDVHSQALGLSELGLSESLCS